MNKSVMRIGILVLATMLGGAIWAAKRPIVVVKPMETCLAVDRAYGQSLAKHVVAWLKDGGVSADLADDRMLETTLAGRRLAYLVLCRRPSPVHLGAIKRFLLRGGKVCVFRCEAPELAKLMNVNLAKCAQLAAGGEKIALGGRLPPGAPTSIVQAGGGAVLGTIAGWWSTAVFSSEGDERAKQRFLLAAAGASVPGCWDANAWLARERQHEAVLKVFAKKQVKRPGEIHAVWDHTGQGLYPGDWPRTMRLLAANGITDLFVNVAGAGFAHYPSTRLAASAVCRQKGDQLAACLAAAKGRGIRVHAWMLCFNASRGPETELAKFKRLGWRLTNKKGVLTDYVNPARADVRAHVLAGIDELVRRYGVDGVHLDFVRWYEGAAKPANAKATITAFVAAARAKMKAARPRAWLTAAVMAGYPDCAATVGQDWGTWIDRGLIDYAVPMNYEEDNDRYAALLARQTRVPNRARRIISGLGVTANESHLGAVKVIDQIHITRQRGLPGVALFDLDYTLATEILPYLKMGMF